MQKNLVFLESLVSKAGSQKFNPNLPKIERQIFEMESCVYKTVAQAMSAKEKKKNLSSFLEIFILVMERLNDSLTYASEKQAGSTKKILDRLTGFIELLETNADNWFNYNLNTPAFMVGELNKKLKGNVIEIETGLSRMNMPKDLVHVALNPLKMHYGPKNKIRLHRYFYLLRYCSWLSEFMQNKVHFYDHECSFIQLLITKNLNSRLFQTFLTKYLQDKLNADYTPYQKLNKLRNLQICLTDLTPSTKLRYSNKNQSTPKFFQKALTNRIHFYELLTKEAPTSCVNEQDSAYISRRLQTSLKVSHIGILCRLLHDDGQIINSSGSLLTDAMAEIFEHRTGAPISRASLRNKFYSLDEKSLKEFKTIIKSWEERIKDLLYDLNYK